MAEFVQIPVPGVEAYHSGHGVSVVGEPIPEEFEHGFYSKAMRKVWSYGLGPTNRNAGKSMDLPNLRSPPGPRQDWHEVRRGSEKPRPKDREGASVGARA